MKKISLLLLISILVLVSCATYTVGKGEEVIQPKEKKVDIKEEVVKEDDPLDSIKSYPALFFEEKVKLNKVFNKEISTLLLPVRNKDFIDIYCETIKELNPNITMVTGDKKIILDIINKLEEPAVLYKEDSAIITKYPLEISNEIATANLGDEHKATLLVKSIGKDEDLELLNINFEKVKSNSPNKVATLDKSIKLISNDNPVILGLSSYEPSLFDWNKSLDTFPYRKDYQWDISKFLDENMFIDSYYDTRGNSEPQFSFTWTNSSIRERSDFIFLKGAIAIDSKRVNLSQASEVHSNNTIGRYGIYTKLIILN